MATISSTLREYAQTLVADESSGVDYHQLCESLGKLKNLVLGDKLAHGMVLTFGMSTPHIHILNTEVKPILQSLREHGAKISESVEKYQGISGITPSKSALRVFSLVLKKITPDDPDARAQLKTICDEARDLDLVSPANKDWKREMTLQLDGRNVRVSLSLTPISSFTKLLQNCVRTDIPKEDLKNNYAYKLTLEPEFLRESSSLRQLKQMGRQLVTTSAMGAPIVATLSFVSELGFAAQISAVTATVAATACLLRYANANMLLGPNNNE